MRICFKKCVIRRVYIYTTYLNINTPLNLINNLDTFYFVLIFLQSNKLCFEVLTCNIKLKIYQTYIKFDH